MRLSNKNEKMEKNPKKSRVSLKLSSVLVDYRTVQYLAPGTRVQFHSLCQNQVALLYSTRVPGYRASRPSIENVEGKVKPFRSLFSPHSASAHGPPALCSPRLARARHCNSRCSTLPPAHRRLRLPPRRDAPGPPSGQPRPSLARRQAQKETAPAAPA